MLAANDPELQNVTWRKAAKSDSGGQCVELADLGGDRIALRNSREPDQPAHVFTRSEIACLIDGARNGEFDDLTE